MRTITTRWGNVSTKQILLHCNNLTLYNNIFLLYHIPLLFSTPFDDNKKNVIISSIIDGIGLDGFSTVCLTAPFHVGIDGEYSNSRYRHNTALIIAAIGRSNKNFFISRESFTIEDTCIITQIPPKEISPVTTGIDIYVPSIWERELISKMPFMNLLITFTFDESKFPIILDIVGIMLNVSNIVIATLNIIIIEHIDNSALVLEFMLLIRLVDDIFSLIVLLCERGGFVKKPIKTAIITLVSTIDVNIIMPIHILLYKRSEIMPIINDGPLQKQ